MVARCWLGRAAIKLRSGVGADPDRARMSASRTKPFQVVGV
jgi:hypothetical protein